MSRLLYQYNLDNNRPDDQVAYELEAFARLPRLAVLGIVEAIGNTLIDLPGFQKIRSTKNRSRLNIAAYVRDDLDISSISWIDLERTWPRTEGPGIHEARSILAMDVEDTQVIVGHQGPPNIPTAAWVQQEGIDELTTLMAPWKRAGWIERQRKHQKAAKAKQRIALADWNRRKGEPGPGPDMLAQRIGGKVIGGRIDAAVVRNVDVTMYGYPERVAGTRLLSDHGHAFFMEVDRL